MVVMWKDEVKVVIIIMVIIISGNNYNYRYIGEYLLHANQYPKHLICI